MKKLEIEPEDIFKVVNHLSKHTPEHEEWWAIYSFGQDIETDMISIKRNDFALWLSIQERL